MGKCRLYYDLISSLIGLLLNSSAFIVFGYVYDEIQACSWAGFSAIFAGVCLQIHIVYWKDRLESYHTPQTLSALEALGLVVMLTGLAATIWYIFALNYWHTPILPVKGSFLIISVWSLSTSKWGLALFLSSRRYASILRRNFTPLNQSI